jgi:hypothetical protein
LPPVTRAAIDFDGKGVKFFHYERCL